MKNTLADIIEYFSVPALALSLRGGTVAAANMAALKSFGGAVSEGMPVETEGLPENPSGPVFLKVSSARGSLALAVCPKEGADLMLRFFPEGLALALGVPSANLGPAALKPGPPPAPGEETNSQAPQFHLSYVISMATGKWACSQPEILLTMGLAGSAAAAAAFDWRSAICPEDLPLYDNTMSAVKSRGGAHEINYRIKLPSGGRITVADYCGAVTPAGAWPLVAGAIVNIDRAMEETHKTERQMLLGRLLGGMIHDFKNLLGGIHNYIEWTASISDDPRVKDALRKTLDYTAQASGLITGALKACSGKNEGRIEKIDIGELVEGMSDLLRKALPSSIYLRVSAKSGLHPVYGEKNALKDMLLNLCVNARDAMRDSGDTLKIEVSNKKTWDESGGSGDFVSLRIEDNGCGMSETEIKSIFDAFYSTKETGAGLGLWMVRRAVRSFDGVLNVTSEPGKGSVFEILFPAAGPPPGYDPSEEISAEKENSSGAVSFSNYCLPEGQRRLALYIEDEPLIRTSVAAWLESFGFDLLVSEDGATGWRVFVENKDRIDVVIQDYILPGIKGDKLLADFLRLKPGLPVIISSANSGAEGAEEFKRLGAFAYLEKPFKIERLTAILNGIFPMAGDTGSKT
jgi:signal transduction histidine kinase/CheY-like chemotaxis protein